MLSCCVHLSLISALPPTITPNLTIVGGQSAAVSQLADTLASHVGSSYQSVVRVRAFEDLKVENVALRTVVLLAELDEPLLKNPTLAKHETLQMLWREGTTVLWVSQGCRADSPHAAMSVGLCRCAHYEYGNLTLQRLDVDHVDLDSARIVAEELLRLECLGTWGKDLDKAALLWSLEPEVYIESGVRMIPRLCGSVNANRRYNTYKRTFEEEVDPQSAAVLFASSEDELRCEVHLPSPLQLPTLPPLPGKIRTMRITHFVLPSVALEIASPHRVMLCVSIDDATHEKVLAVSHAAESPLKVLEDLTWVLEESTDQARLLLAVTVNIISANMLRLVDPNSSVLVHEPNSELASALMKQARAEGISLTITTSTKSRSSNGWTYIHGRFSHRQVRSSVTIEPSVFFDLSPLSNSDSQEAGLRIAESIPAHCAHYRLDDLFGSRPELTLGVSLSRMVKLLHGSLLAVRADNATNSQPVAPVIPLGDISSYATTGKHPAVVDCTGSPNAIAKAAVQAIDSGTIFRDDRTYCLFGLANEVGQSLCQWMCKHGAKHVVMTSRTPKVGRKFLEHMARLGANVKVLLW